MKFSLVVFTLLFTSSFTFVSSAATADELSKELMENSSKLCNRYFEKFKSENKKAKTFDTGDKNLIVNTCTLRLLKASLDCTVVFETKVAEEIKGKQKQESEIHAITKREEPVFRKCLNDVNERGEEDIKLLGAMTMSGRKDLVKSTVDGWTKDGSMPPVEAK